MEWSLFSYELIVRFHNSFIDYRFTNLVQTFYYESYCSHIFCRSDLLERFELTKKSSRV